MFVSKLPSYSYNFPSKQFYYSHQSFIYLKSGRNAVHNRIFWRDYSLGYQVVFVNRFFFGLHCNNQLFCKSARIYLIRKVYVLVEQELVRLADVGTFVSTQFYIHYRV